MVQKTVNHYKSRKYWRSVIIHKSFLRCWRFSTFSIVGAVQPLQRRPRVSRRCWKDCGLIHDISRHKLWDDSWSSITDRRIAQFHLVITWLKLSMGAIFFTKKESLAMGHGSFYLSILRNNLIVLNKDRKMFEWRIQSLKLYWSHYPQFISTSSF